MWICHNSAPLCQWIFRLFIIFLSSEMLRGHVHLWKDFFFLLLSDIFRIYSHRIAGQTKSKMRLGSGWVWPGCFLKTLYGRAITSRPRERTHRCDGHRRPRGGAEGGHWCLPQSTGGESALSRTQMHISVLQTLCTSFKGDTVFCCPLLALPDCSQSRHSPGRVCAYLALTVKFQQARSREGGFMVLMIITLHSFELSAFLKN